MMLVDYVMWAAILFGGLVLSIWYGASWWAVARALAEPEPAPAVKTHRQTGPRNTQGVPRENLPAGLLVQART